MGVAYRLRQVWLAYTVRRRPLPESALAEIAGILSPAEWALFQQYSRRDQWHTYEVMRALQAGGHTDRRLLAAALLHDVGKTRLPLNQLDRTLPVLAEAVAPDQARRWGEGRAQGWRKAFVVRRQHGQWGAEMAKNAGSDPLTVCLIRHHDDKQCRLDPPADLWLAALQRADDAA